MAQHPMKVVLLDLDGTLTKSDGGIIASVVKTFEELGRPVPDDAELHRFIGPVHASNRCDATMYAGGLELDRAVRANLPQLLLRIARCSMIRTSPATKFPAAW